MTQAFKKAQAKRHSLVLSLPFFHMRQKQILPRTWVGSPIYWESNPFIANIRSRPKGPWPSQLSLVSSYFYSTEKLKLTNCLGRCAALCCLFLSRMHYG